MYKANCERYKNFEYSRLGNSGLKLPPISLGFWHNFGSDADLDVCKRIMFTAFDGGITHFDLANNYGPVYGSAEENFGKLFRENFVQYRDELIISTKAGYDMWDGPYGDWGSKKYLVASLNQSLKRMGLEYVDIFYHHRPDSGTNIEETACALDLLVRQGKALYIGVSNYNADETRAIAKIFHELRTPFVINQARYNIMDRWIENGLTDALADEKIGGIAFCPLAQGLLTNRYLNGIPSDSRATHSRFLHAEQVEKTLDKVKKLNIIAQNRNQTLAQMALAWTLNNKAINSALIGASKSEQVSENLQALNNLSFSAAELTAIDKAVE